MSRNLLPDESQPLSNDIFLAEEHFEIIGGGGGFNTEFIVSERKVIHQKWFYSPVSGSENSEEELLIPDCISSEEELRHFVEMHNPHWLK